LPIFSKLINLPENGNFVLEDLRYDYEEIKLEKNIIPVGWEDGVSSNKNYYEENEWFPEKIVRINKPIIMRGCRFAQISISPVKYNPGLQKLRILKNIRAEFKLDRSINENPIMKKSYNLFPEVLKILKKKYCRL